MKKVGIWIRVSTDMQAQGDSPEVHEKRARMYAELNGWEVVEIYHLESMSGKSVINLTETKRMLHDIKSGRIEALIFSKIARFARNTRELLDFAEIFEHHGADMVSLGESIDTSTPAGRLFFTIISALAQWEREEISERVAASVPVRAEMGKSLGGQAPFGYEWGEDKQLVIHEEEANIRRHIYELFLKHKRKRTVARLLNEQGYTTRNGSKFSDATIRRLLEDTIAKGIRKINYTTARKGKKEIKGEDNWVFVQAPPIISEEKWDNIQSILKEQAEHHQKPLKTNLHLFTGIANCSCGSKMYVLSKTDKYVCKLCKQKIPCDVLESIFQEELHSFALDEKSLDTIMEQDDKYRQSQERLLDTTNKEIAKTEKSIDSLFALHEQGQLKTEDFGSRYKMPKEKIEKLKEQKADIEYQLQQSNSKKSLHLKIFDTLKDVYGNWNKLEKTEKRGIIEAMAETIIIDDESVEIVLKQISPSFSESVTFGQHNYKDSSQQST